MSRFAGRFRAFHQVLRFVPWCTCPCHCRHSSLSGDEGPVAELGRMPKRWRCDECGTIVHDNVLPTEGNQHEFVPSESDENRCRHCNGYPLVQPQENRCSDWRMLWRLWGLLTQNLRRGGALLLCAVPFVALLAIGRIRCRRLSVPHRYRLTAALD